MKHSRPNHSSDDLKRQRSKPGYFKFFLPETRLRKRLTHIVNNSNLLRPSTRFKAKIFQNLDKLYNVSINDSSNYSICSKRFSSIFVWTRKNCLRCRINSVRPKIESTSLTDSAAPNAHSSTFINSLKHLTNILFYLKINQSISFLNYKINEYLLSHETKVPIKRNYLKKIVLKPNMLDINTFNLEGFVQDLDHDVKKKTKLKESNEHIEKHIHMDSTYEDNLQNQMDESNDSLHNFIAHDIRCFSEPPDLKLNKSFPFLLKSKNNQHFLNGSPTIKILFNNLVKKHKESIFPISNSQSLCSIRIEDFIHMFKCNNLLLKRSFSSNRLKLDKEVIKKSPSFEKFLKNVLQGKKKSNSLCNFSSGSKTFCNDNDSTKASNSSDSENLDCMMTSMMNGRKKSSWPVLKIDDQEKKIDQNAKTDDNETNSDGYIPENVRNALEQAGINIDEIISMTNQLQMSFKKDMEIKKSMVKSHTFSNEQITTTRTIFTNEEKTNFENKLENLIDNLKSFEANKEKIKSNGELISVSNVKNFQVKQNLNAKISQQVENKIEPVQNVLIRSVKNNRKKSCSNRYATVSNFNLSYEQDTNSSTSWIDTDMNNFCPRQSPKIIPAKIVGQFKPVVNIHRRLPVAQMNKMINSKSTDTFSNLTNCYENLKEEADLKFVNLNETNGDQMISIVDLTQPLSTKRSTKRGNVIRSFSYNNGKIYENKMGLSENKKQVSESDSFGKVIAKCKKPLFSVNESLDLESDHMTKGNYSDTKNFSGLNVDHADPDVIAGRLNIAMIQDKLPKIEINEKSDNFNSNDSKSSNNLSNSFSASSLSGILENDFSIYKNNDHVS